MSKTVHPYAFRLGIIRDWRSRWFAPKTKHYADFLRADVLIRERLMEALRGMYVDAVEIERTPALFHVIVKTARPGLVIGRRGEGTTRLKRTIAEAARKIGAEMPREVKLTIEEVKAPETHARVAAEMIIESLEKRTPFRRTMRQVLEKIMLNRGVQGAKVMLAGRLDGAEMSRRETMMRGRVPLQTIRADLDFARERAHLPYGDIGVKVWIYRGDIFEEKKYGPLSQKS